MITAICLFSNLTKYREAVAATLNTVSELTAVIYSASEKNLAFEALLKAPCTFVRQSEGGDDNDATTKVAEIYDRCFQLVKTPYTLTLEQDIVPLPGVIDKLIATIKNSGVTCASAVYDQGDGEGYSNAFFSFGASGRGGALTGLPKDAFPVVFALIGCSVFNTEILSKALPMVEEKLCSSAYWEGSLAAKFYNNGFLWVAIGSARCTHKGI